MTTTMRIAAALVTGGLALGVQALAVAPAGAATTTDQPAAAADRQQEGGDHADQLAAKRAGQHGPSRGHPRASYETYKNESTGECLDNLDDIPWTYDCDGSSEQDWSVTHWGDGTVRFKNRATGTCLSDRGHTLGAESCSTSEYQSFYVKHWNDGTMRFQNEATGDCVKAASGHDVGTTTCDKSEAQSWY